MMSGNLPDSVFGLKNLRELDLSLNGLSGEIPEVTATFNLTDINLSVNNFKGKIPQSFGELQKLFSLSVMINQLSGEIPNGIARLPALGVILLSRNDFSATLPPALGQYSSLRVIELYSNRFTGGLPKNLCAKGKLITLDASDNNLSGELFESLRNCHSLVTLRINSNMFSGRIPAEISSWKHIMEFKAKTNRLSGPIPETIASLPSLGLIDLSKNWLSGPIPNQLGVHTYIEFINLSSNHLVGKVPRSLRRFTESFLNNPGLSSSKLSSKVVISIVTASVIAACFVVLSSYMLVSKLRRRKTKVLIKPTDLTWKFIPFHILSFRESNILSGLTKCNVVGQGGSGKVYRVSVGGTESFVAVKRICSNRKVDQNLEKQFLAEVNILGKIRHLKIVKLLCCISSESSKLLVYEYMDNQSLDWWLHGNTGGSDASLVWPVRLKIAIGAAQGLCYMHHNCSPPIIHRDVKSGNILLDAEFNAKVADFGLAKLVVTVGQANTASAVAGSFGYIAPEYARTKRLNEKIDVYNEHEHTGLAQWACRHMQEGNHIPDALDGDIRNSPDHVEEMVNMFKLGIFCTGMLPSARPSMKEVLQILQSFHLQN